MTFKNKFKDIFILAIILIFVCGGASGVLFGVFMGDMAVGMMFGILFGVAFGTIYPVIMHFIGLAIERKYVKQREEIKKDRELVCDGPANMNQNVGWLFFTEKGLEFYPHKINYSTDKVVIPIDMIAGVESTQNKLIVKLASDISYTFIVNSNNEWKKCIDYYISTKKEGQKNKEREDEPLTRKTVERKPGDAYVFISYSSHNQSHAEATRALLTGEGVKTWMAPYDIPAGSKYAYVINDAIENCACVLLLLTEDSQASQFVEREIERAVAYKKTIVSMRLDDSDLNPGFRYFLGSYQIIPVKELDKNNSAIQKVIESLKYMVSD